MCGMNWKNWIKKENETLWDLIFGCIVYGILAEIIGLFVVKNKATYSAGLVLGVVIAIGLSVSMFRSLNRCLILSKRQAGRMMVFGTLIRAAVIILVVWLSMRLRYFSFPAVVVGILGLKISAYLHTYTNVYITKKIWKKGR